MANQLNMAEIGAILTLHKSEHSNRAIAELLEVDRGTVGKYVAQAEAQNGPRATSSEVPAARGRRRGRREPARLGQWAAQRMRALPGTNSGKGRAGWCAHASSCSMSLVAASGQFFTRGGFSFALTGNSRQLRPAAAHISGGSGSAGSFRLPNGIVHVLRSFPAHGVRSFCGGFGHAQLVRRRIEQPGQRDILWRAHQR